MSAFVPEWFGSSPDVSDRLEGMIELLYRSILNRGDTALDGGAHVGRHTFPMAECVGAEGEVYGIEPLTRLSAYIDKESIRRNLTQVKVISAALAATSGEVTFEDVRTMPGYSGLRRRDYPDSSFEVTRINIEAVTIDSILGGVAARRCKFWKLDLEGGEYHAIQGGSATIRRDGPVIILENGRENAARNYDYSKEDFFSLFRGQNYLLFDLFGNVFDEARWNVPAVPWYSIAVPSHSELARDIPSRMITFCHRVADSKN